MTPDNIPDAVNELAPEKPAQAARATPSPAEAPAFRPRNAGEIEIYLPALRVLDGKTRLSADICVGEETKNLWFEIDSCFGHYFSTDTLDAFVAASLIPAIQRGENIRVRGPMSAKLYYNLAYSLIPILCEYLGKPRRTQVFAERLLRHDTHSGRGVAAGFSGGIDSFCNYFDHSGERVPDEFSLTHFIFNNVGSHGQKSPEADRHLFRQRFTRLRECAARIGKPAVAVDSNLDEFMGEMFQLTHTLRNTAVALSMQNAFSKFLYSSGYPLAETKLGPDYNMSRLDPVILPLLSTERLECMASGGQHTRVEKTRRVIEIEESRSYLDVCVCPQKAPAGVSNCGICWKCIRTATTLKVFGRLEEYGRIFDLKTFRCVENLYLIEVMGGKSPFSKEIRSLIAEKKFPVPRAVRLAAALMPASVAQQFSIRIIPLLLRSKPLARFVNGCLAW